MVAGNAQHLVARITKPLQEAARLLELLGPCALREISADDDEVGLEPVDIPFDRFDEILVVGAEMQVGKVGEARPAR